jgi:hypothetical protein
VYLVQSSRKFSVPVARDILWKLYFLTSSLDVVGDRDSCLGPTQVTIPPGRGLRGRFHCCSEALDSMSVMLKVTRHLARRFTSDPIPKNRPLRSFMTDRPKLLLVGVYIANIPNYVPRLVKEFSAATMVDVEQRWASMRGGPPNDAVKAVTVARFNDYEPKWKVVNDLIVPGDLERFDYFAVSDDDIRVGKGFIDSFISEQQALDFALAQPARTWRSFSDHGIVRRRLFTRARQTSFVEAGPLVFFRRDFFQVAYPFSQESPMGWGYDLTWPILARERKLAIGIIDSVPVDHSLRPRGAIYNDRAETETMARYLSTRPHVGAAELTRSLRVYR